MKRLFSFTTALFALLLIFSPCTGDASLSRTARSSAYWGGSAVLSAGHTNAVARFTSQKESDIHTVLRSSGKFRPSSRNRAGGSGVLIKSGGWDGLSSSCVTSVPFSGAFFPALSRFDRLTAWVQSVI